MTPGGAPRKQYPSMRYAVSGASGFIGDALARRLEAEGHTVIRLVRRPAEKPDEVEWQRLLVDREQRERLGNLDGVVNLAGSNLAAGRWTARRKEAILRSRVESTRALVGVMSRLPHPPPVLVNASAVGYYGDRGEEELTEESGKGAGFLAEACRAWEEEAETAGRFGIRTVMVRFGMVIGSGGGVFARMAPLFRAGFGGALGDGQQWASWIALDDAVDATFRVLCEPEFTGPVNAVAPNPVRNGEFSEILAGALGRRTFARVPAWVLRTVFGEMADEMLLASLRVRPQRLLKGKFRFAHPDLEATLRAVVEESVG